jgi:hypothetical protein
MTGERRRLPVAIAPWQARRGISIELAHQKGGEHIMGLLSKEMAEQLPPLYANEELGLAAQALVKFFTPDSNWTWYASEYDPDEGIFFGYVIGHADELGYFSLAELEDARGPLGLAIERDEGYTPKSLEEIMEHYREHGYAL